jgi:transposase-like protein
VANQQGGRALGKEITAVKKESTEGARESRVVWGGLEGWLRGKVQEFVQDVLEDEVTELLGRGRSERRVAVDGQRGYRNGHGKPRRLTLSCGTIELCRPRVRDVEERVASRVLPLFVRRTAEVNALIPELYLHGLAAGDFDLALRGLLGEDAPVSASTVGRLKAKWQTELEAWKTRRLDELEIVYVWADGVYVKAGLEREKAAVLVVIGADSEGCKHVLAISPGYRESTESWAEVLRDLKARGLKAPRLAIGDGALGLWGALAQVYPDAAEQRCWNHKIINVLDKLPRKLQGQAKLLLRVIPYADSQAEAERLKKKFEAWCGRHGLSDAARTLARDWERMLTFFDFPKPHWKHLRTTNPVESPFAALRLRTDAARRFKRVDNATAVMWKLLLLAESRFRRLDAPELLTEVVRGARFVDGVKIKTMPQEVAA